MKQFILTFILHVSFAVLVFGGNVSGTIQGLIIDEETNQPKNETEAKLAVGQEIINSIYDYLDEKKVDLELVSGSIEEKKRNKDEGVAERRGRIMELAVDEKGNFTRESLLTASAEVEKIVGSVWFAPNPNPVASNAAPFSISLPNSFISWGKGCVFSPLRMSAIFSPAAKPRPAPPIVPTGPASEPTVAPKAEAPPVKIGSIPVSIASLPLSSLCV